MYVFDSVHGYCGYEMILVYIFEKKYDMRNEETGSFPTSFDLTTLCERLSKSPPFQKSVRIPQRVISSIIRHRDDSGETRIIRVPTKNRETSCERNIIILCDLEHFREILAGKQRDASNFVVGENEKIIFTIGGCIIARGKPGGKWEGDGETFVRCQPSVRYGP